MRESKVAIELPWTTLRRCPVCGYAFKYGFQGTHFHWKAKHERIMPTNRHGL